MEKLRGNFAEEVLEQFLVCHICSNIYVEPKMLSCLHTFCSKCLEDNYLLETRERSYTFLLYNKPITCVLCTKKTELPYGGISRLPDNTLIQKLGNVLQKNQPLSEKCSKPCDICIIGSNGPKEATAKCLDCLKLLCETCSELHINTKVTKFHSIISLESEKNIHCKIHKDELIKYYCESCQECICTLCAFHQHKEHQVALPADVFDESKFSLSNLLEDCNNKIGVLKNHLDYIEWCNDSMKNTENKVRESVTETIIKIRQKEREIISSIPQIFGVTVSEILGSKELLKENLQKLENIREDVSSTNDNIEVLVAKKKLQTEIDEISKNDNIHFGLTLQKNHSVFEKVDIFETIKKALELFFSNLDDFKLENKSCTEDKNTQTNKVEIVDELQKKSLAIVKPTVKTEEKSTEVDIEENPTKPPKPVWSKSMIRIEVENNIIPVNHIYLTPSKASNAPKTRDNFTSMEQIFKTERSIQTKEITKKDNYTATMQKMVMHKNIGTVSQEKKDKSTCTSFDVSLISKIKPTFQNENDDNKTPTTPSGPSVNPVFPTELLNQNPPASTIKNDTNSNVEKSIPEVHSARPKSNSLKPLARSSLSLNPLYTSNQDNNMKQNEKKTNNVSDSTKKIENTLTEDKKVLNNLKVNVTKPLKNLKSSPMEQYKSLVLRLPGCSIAPGIKEMFSQDKNNS